MGSKGIKLLFALLVIPMIALSQGVAFRKADTALVTSDNGQFRIFKSQPYYNSLMALKEPKFTTLSVSKGGTGRSTITPGALLKGNATGVLQDAVAGTDYVIPSALTAYALNSAVVHNTGNETVAGIKTFTSVVKGIDPVANVDLTTKQYVDGQTGWAIYNDNVYTSGSPLVINSGVTATVTNNSNTSITTQLPIGVTSFYNSSTSKITPQLDGDFYTINIRFTAVSSSTSGIFDLLLDIGAPMNVILSETRYLNKGIGASQRISIIFPIYSASTFITNGGLIRLNSITGNTSIYDIAFTITRTHKAR